VQGFQKRPGKALPQIPDQAAPSLGYLVRERVTPALADTLCLVSTHLDQGFFAARIARLFGLLTHDCALAV
jgi:hypothetical protein